MDGEGRRAVVLGAGLAGLLSAGVLARHVDEVVLVERDVVSAPAGGARRGVPQGRHTHGLLVAGSRALERLLPGLTQELLSQGAIRADLARWGRWWLGGAEQARFDSGLEGLLASRPLIEDEVRRRVLGLPNVVLLDGHDVAGLLSSEDASRVTGARVTGARVAARGTGQVCDLPADLVVDATGRGSRAATWVADLGYPPVEELAVEAGITYVTRIFRHRAGVLDDSYAEIVGTDPAISRSGVALRQENDVWSVTLAGSFGEQPPTDLDGFRRFAAALPLPGLTEVTTGCEPIGDARVYRFPYSRWLRWHEMARRPEGLVVIGDAVCSFNPVYGQGMTVAAGQAEALDSVLAAGDPADLPERAAKAIAAVVAAPWEISTGADRRHASQPPKRWFERLTDRYQDRVTAVAPLDLDIALAFYRVLNQLDPPTALISPGLVARVLLTRRR